MQLLEKPHFHGTNYLVNFQHLFAKRVHTALSTDASKFLIYNTKTVSISLQYSVRISGEATSINVN